MKVKVIRCSNTGNMYLANEDNEVLMTQTSITVTHSVPKINKIKVNCEFIFDTKDFKIEEIEVLNR